MNSGNYRKYVITVVVAAAVLTSVGAAWALRARPTARPSVLPLAYTKTVTTPGRRLAATADTPTSILQALIARLGSPAVLSASISRAPAGYRPSEEPNAGQELPALKQPWVQLKIRAADDGLSSILPMWHANLVVGDLREEMHALNPSNPLFGESISLVSAKTKLLTKIDTNVGDISYGQAFSDASDAAVRTQIRSAAPAASLQVKSIVVFHGLDVAPAVIATTTDPRQFVANADLAVNALFGGQAANYEGVYLEVADTAGNAVYVTASSFRTGIGATWIAPSLHAGWRSTDDGSPMPHTGTPSG